MSQKLSNKEISKSLEAINQYRIDNPDNGEKRVIVVKNGKTIFNDVISVITGNYNIYLKIDILWEDANFDYKKNGLYGSYSSTYNKITYDNKIMDIYSSNNIIISII